MIIVTLGIGHWTGVDEVFCTGNSSKRRLEPGGPGAVLGMDRP